jgi:hypothetical protein
MGKNRGRDKQTWCVKGDGSGREKEIMKWAKIRPVKTGWYWAKRYNVVHIVEVVHDVSYPLVVRIFPEHLAEPGNDAIAIYPLDNASISEWAGPLEPPRNSEDA